MNRLLLFLFLCASALGATGDLSAPTVGTNGWDAFITIVGISTNGTYDFKLKSVNGQKYPTANTPYFTVTSMGYDDTGTQITVSRKVYATAKVRMAYPNGQYSDESLSGGNVTVHFALHDQIYAKDSTNLVFTDPQGGFYTVAGVTNNPTTSLAATDNSTFAYPPVLANWTRVPNQRFVNTATGYMFGIGAGANSGRPLRVVKFSATDAHSHTATAVYITKATFDTTSTDLHKHAIEYVGNVDISGFTQGDQCKLQFIAYPWIGDTVLDTSDGVNTPPHPNYTYQNFLCDNAGTYGAVYAVVDPVNGSASGVAGTNTFNPASPPTPFLTIAAAATAIRGTNNTMYGHNDCGGGTVYVTNCTTAWMGASGTYGATPKTWLTVRNYPGVAVANVGITTQSGDKGAPMTKIEGLNVTAASASGVFASMTYLWVDGCILNSGTSPCFYSQTIQYFTGNTIPKLQGGLEAFATGNYPYAIVRGNDLSGFSGPVVSYVVMSNYKDNTPRNNTDAIQFQERVSTSSGCPYPTTLLICFNELYGMYPATGAILDIATGNTSGGVTNGFAILQNLVECTNQAAPTLASIGADSTTNQYIQNIVEHNNTLLGQRQNNNYDQVATTFTRYLGGWYVLNNIFDCRAQKSDTFNTPPRDGTRTRNWQNYWGCRDFGNLNATRSWCEESGSFAGLAAGVDTGRVHHAAIVSL